MFPFQVFNGQDPELEFFFYDSHFFFEITTFLISLVPVSRDLPVSAFPVRHHLLALFT